MNETSLILIVKNDENTLEELMNKIVIRNYGQYIFVLNKTIDNSEHIIDKYLTRINSKDTVFVLCDDDNLDHVIESGIYHSKYEECHIMFGDNIDGVVDKVMRKNDL
jgi:hypothetical protein